MDVVEALYAAARFDGIAHRCFALWYPHVGFVAYSSQPTAELEPPCLRRASRNCLWGDISDLCNRCFEIGWSCRCFLLSRIGLSLLVVEGAVPCLFIPNFFSSSGFDLNFCAIAQGHESGTTCFG
jgi:hypothetical protein